MSQINNDSTLRDRLLEIIGREKFVPISEARKLVTVEAVRSHLQLGREEAPTWLEERLPCSLKLVTILILIGGETYVQQFLKQGMSDKIFPVKREEVPNFKDIDHENRFYDKQHIVPPIFRSSEQLTLSKSAILPFELDESESRNGSFGIVWRYRVPNGHIENFHVGGVVHLTKRS
jgi:hypothetical protein